MCSHQYRNHVGIHQPDHITYVKSDYHAQDRFRCECDWSYSSC